MSEENKKAKAAFIAKLQAIPEDKFYFRADGMPLAVEDTIRAHEAETNGNTLSQALGLGPTPEARKEKQARADGYQAGVRGYF